MHKFKFVNSKVNDFKNKENIIITEPFFICSIDNFLDEKLYKDLYDNFPPTDFFVSHNPDKGNKVALDVRSKLVTDYIENNAAWKSFTNSINSQESSNFFKKVAIRPGKPILFAKIKGKQKAIFGLPGNPISSAACFRFFVQPYIMDILGVPIEKPIKAILNNSYTKNNAFTHFAKCRLKSKHDGKLVIEVLKGQESFRIQSFVSSNIWSLFPSGKSKFLKGELVDCYFPNSYNNSLI